VRGTNQPTCAYRLPVLDQSNWGSNATPIASLDNPNRNRQKDYSCRPSRPEKMEQMVPNDQKFLPIACWGWACRRLRKTTTGGQGVGRKPAKAPARERERSGNEGVGEHVRTRFHGGPWGPVKLRTMRSAPNEENLFLLPEGLSRSELLETTIQPFDLMSRRHPLSSTRAFRLKSASRSRSS
jgi:hypothetical protein